MKQYKQKEVAKIEDVTDRTVTRWSKEELNIRGWIKHGEGNGCFYTREQDQEVDNAISEASILKTRKLKAELINEEAKNEKQKRIYFHEWNEKNNRYFNECFIELRNELVNAKFDNDNIEKWNKAIEICVTNYQKKSENIYNSEDM